MASKTGIGVVVKRKEEARFTAGTCTFRAIALEKALAGDVSLDA